MSDELESILDDLLGEGEEKEEHPPEPEEEEKGESHVAEEEVTEEPLKEVMEKVPEVSEEEQREIEEVLGESEGVKKEDFGEFEIEEVEDVEPKYVFLIFGEKGSGKTSVALSFPGTVAVISFDRKSAIIKKTRFNNDSRIRIFDGVKYMDYTSPATTVKTAEITYEYLVKLIEYIREKVKPDWIVFDGAEIMQQICEWTMRARHNLEAFQGISNLNLWKERRMLLRQLHKLAYEAARKGVIYTTYVAKDEVVIDGTVVTRKDVPKWIDVLVYETDFVVKTELDPVERGFRVKVVTSKDDSLLPTGAVYDVTDRKFWEVVKGG